MPVAFVEELAMPRRRGRDPFAPMVGALTAVRGIGTYRAVWEACESLRDP